MKVNCLLSWELVNAKTGSDKVFKSFWEIKLKFIFSLSVLIK